MIFSSAILFQSAPEGSSRVGEDPPGEIRRSGCGLEYANGESGQAVKITERRDVGTDASKETDPSLATGVAESSTDSERLDWTPTRPTTQEHGVNKTEPAGEGEISASRHRIGSACPPVTRVGANATPPTQQMASRIAVLEAAPIDTQQKVADVTDQLGEELHVAPRRGEGLNAELVDVKQRRQVKEAEEQRHREQKATEVINQLAEERHATLQREEILSAALSEAERRLQAVKLEGLEAQRRSELKISNATIQLIEEYYATRQREEALGAALSEANQLVDAARQRENTLNAALSEARRHLEAKEDEAKELRQAVRKGEEATNRLLDDQRAARQREEAQRNKLAEAHHAARQREAALNATVSDANRRLQTLKEGAVEAQRRTEQKAAETTTQLTEALNATRRREAALGASLGEANNHLKMAKENAVEIQRRSKQREAEADQLVEAARQREDTLTDTLAEVRKHLHAKEDEVEELRRTVRKGEEATNRLSADLQASRQSEEAQRATLSEARKQVRAAKADGAVERQRTADALNKLAEERHAAGQREQALSTALTVAKQRRREPKPANTSTQLLEELNSARQREEELNNALSEAKKHLWEAQADAMEAQRRSEEKNVNATRQLDEERHAAHQREQALNAALAEANKRRREPKAANPTTQLTEELKSARQREQELNSALSAAQNQITVFKANRAANRVFTEIEDVNSETVIALFSDVVEAVNELVFFVVDDLDEAAQTSSVMFDRVCGLATTDDLTGNMLSSFLLPMARAKANFEHVAFPVMQFIAFAVLTKRVFLPTSLAGPDASGAGQHLGQLQALVAAREPQEKYGRWRAITYGALRTPENDNALARNIAMEIYKSIAPVLVAMLPPSHAQDEALGQRLFQGFEDRATMIVLDAIKLQDTMQQVYVSHDYFLFFPATKVQFLANEMEAFGFGPDAMNKLATAVQNTTGGHGTVILPLMPGLRAVRVQQGLPHSEIVVKKALVIALP